MSILSRRNFVLSTLATCGAIASQGASAKSKSPFPHSRPFGPPPFAKSSPFPKLFARPAGSERSISLINAHTDERLDGVYWADGRYLSGTLHQANYVLRDHMSGESRVMDPRVLDLLNNLHRTLGASVPFQVISGYRSPRTNAWMHRHQSGVAAHSLHIKGQAVDIVLPGTDVATLHNAALALGEGGVGYYPRSGFVHVDTGKVREWGMG